MKKEEAKGGFAGGCNEKSFTDVIRRWKGTKRQDCRSEMHLSYKGVLYGIVVYFYGPKPITQPLL